MARSRRLQTYILTATVALFVVAGVACTATPAASPPNPDASTPTELPPPTPVPPTPSEPTPRHLDRSRPPDSTPSPPTPTAVLERPTLTPEEELELAKKEFEKAKGQIFYVSGPHTAGGLIRVAGRDVRLPADEFVAYWVTNISCVIGSPCPEAPYYVIQRGNSSIAVSVGSGTDFGENIEPGEEGAFDFLKAALP